MLSSLFRRCVNPEKVGRRFFCNDSVCVSDLIGRASPCLMIPPYFGGEREMRYKFFSLIHDDVVSFGNKGGKEEVDLMKDERTRWVGSSHGWLALFNSGDMLLLNPVSGRRLPLPPFRSDDDLPVKVILSHSPEEEEECRAVMIRRSNRAAYCHPGRSSDWDDLLHSRPKSVYGDFVYSAGRKSFLCSVRDKGQLCRTECVDFWEHPAMDMACESEVRAPRGDPQTDPGLEWQTYLVSEEESGQLFMVRRYAVDSKSMDYLVYKINEGDSDVELCSSLDDIVMFVGNNHSFAVKASQFPQLIPNSIYFSGMVIFNDDQVVDVFDYNNKESAPFSDEPIKTMFPSHSVLPWFPLALTQDMPAFSDSD